MFRAPPRPSSGAYNCINSLWFYRWRVVVAALLVVVWPVFIELFYLIFQLLYSANLLTSIII
jgi:hypothetical protein